MNAFSVILIILACVFPVFSLIASVIFLSYYGSPDDSRRAFLPRAVLMVAFGLALLSVFLLPLDIANERFEAGMYFGLAILWQVFYTIVCVFVIIIIPFSIFYYEAEDPDKGTKHQLRSATIWTLITGTFVTVIILATYWVFGYANIPYTALFSQQWSIDIDSAVAGGDSSICHNCITDDGLSFNIFVSIFVYIIALVSSLGYSVFILFGGFGLSSLPASLIKAFIKRPQRIRGEEFIQRKLVITERSEKLIDIGKRLMEAMENGSATRSDRATYKEFQNATYQLESDWKVLHKSYFDAGGSVILPFFKLLGGLFCGLLSLLWILQISLYMVVPPPIGPLSPFLNTVFIVLDQATAEFPMIGALFYLVMTFYLLTCVLAGAALLARIVPFVTIHPLIYKDTMMSSMLFNVGLFLFSSVTVNQFATKAFEGYARSTALKTMFGATIEYLTGIYWIYFLSTYLFLASSFIGAVLTVLCWRRKKTEFDNLISSGRLDYDNLAQ